MQRAELFSTDRGKDEVYGHWPPSRRSLAQALLGLLQPALSRLWLPVVHPGDRYHLVDLCPAVDAGSVRVVVMGVR